MRVGLILILVSSAFLGAGCSQGIGDRCVQDSDCVSGAVCQPPGQSAQGGKCVAIGTSATGTGTGGSSDQTGQGGSAGSAGEGGAGGQAGTATDAAPATDAGRDAAATDAHAG